MEKEITEMTSKKIEIEIETETEKDKNLKNNHVRSLTRTNTRKNPLGIIPQMTVILLPHRRIHLTKGKRAKEATQKEVQKIKRKTRRDRETVQKTKIATGRKKRIKTEIMIETKTNTKARR